MTQNNERELHLTKVLKLTALERAIELQSIHGSGAVDLGCLIVLQDMVDELKTPISQNEQQEAVAYVHPDDLNEMNKIGRCYIFKSSGKGLVPLYTSPPKQIPDGWVSVEDRLPKIEGWVYTYTADLPFEEALKYDMGYFCVITGFNADNFNPTHWMPLPTAPTTSLTSETNTEVGE